MAITLTTSPQIVGRNEGSTIKTYLYAWYGGQSGNRCTVYTRLTCVNTGLPYTGTNKAYGMVIGQPPDNGYDSGIVKWGYTPLNTGQEYTVSEVSWGYSGGDRINASALFWTWQYGSADISLSDAVYVPVFNSPPTGLSVSVAETYTNGAKFNVSLSSYGVPSNDSNRYIEAGIMNHGDPYGSPYRFSIARNTRNAQITVNNSSNVAGGLTIQPNTRYYYGGYASNTAMSTSVVSGQFTTRAEAPTVLFITSDTTSASFSYSVPADGGRYNREVQYSLDNGATWKTAATVTSGAATSGTFTLNGLASGAAFTMKTRVYTQAGATNGTSVSFYTLINVDNRENKFYGSDGDRARKAGKIYGVVNGETKLLQKLYGAAPDFDLLLGTVSSPSEEVIGFAPTTFKAKMMADHPTIWANRVSLAALIVVGYPTTPRSYQLQFQFSDGNAATVSGDKTMLNSYGIIMNPLEPIGPQQTRSYIALSPQIVTKLVYQGFGHLDYT